MSDKATLQAKKDNFSRVRRFDLEDVSRGYDVWKEMKPDATGEWVMWDDILPFVNLGLHRRELESIASLLREAAKVIDALPMEYQDRAQVRSFLVDELHGSAYMLEDAKP